MKKLYPLLILILSFNSINAQTFIKKSDGLKIKSFYHQQNINYYLHTEDNNGYIYTILYDTVSSSFSYSGEFSQVRLRIYNGISWLTTKPIKLYSRYTIDAPRIIDILFLNEAVYIAGSFDSTENNLGAGVIKYEFNSWYRVADDLIQTFPDYFEVNKLIKYQNSLVITGNFDSISGNKINGIAILNNNQWKPIGNSGQYGFQNLSNTSNVFFHSSGDSLYVYNKNKIKPDSIEIGGKIIKKIGIYRNSTIEQIPLPIGNINALGQYKNQLTAAITGPLIYIKTLAIFNNGWKYYQLPNNDSFYSTNYLGQFEFNSKLYWVFQSPQAKVILYEFDGINIKFYTEFKVSDNYLNLEFKTTANSMYLSGNFNEIKKESYRDSANKIIEISLLPSVKIYGKCFNDLNSDGIYQMGEPLISKSRVYDNLNFLYGISNGEGIYSFIAPVGSSLRLKASNLLGFSSISEIVLNNLKDTFYMVDIALGSEKKNDIGLYLFSGTPTKAKQGFETVYGAEIINTSDLDQTITIVIQHNSKISNRKFINFSPSFKTSNQFGFSAILKAHSRQFINFSMVYGVNQFNLGEVVNVNAVININDINNKNNRDTIIQTVAAAFDPNIKIPVPSEIVETSDEIKYYIYFENMGNDTALNVTVVDTSQSLLSIKDVAFLSTYPYYVEPKIGQATLIWHFEGIKLPPKKVDSLHSWGYVSFRVKLNKSAKKGDTIYNKAAIFFDYQKPVITNNARIVFKKNNSINWINSDKVKIYPNPSSTYINVEIPYSGEIEFYDVIGQIVFSTYVDQKGRIDLPSILSNGYYVLKIKGQAEAIGTLVISR